MSHDIITHKIADMCPKSCMSVFIIKGTNKVLSNNKTIKIGVLLNGFLN